MNSHSSYQAVKSTACYSGLKENVTTMAQMFDHLATVWGSLENVALLFVTPGRL